MHGDSHEERRNPLVMRPVYDFVPDEEYYDR